MKTEIYEEAMNNVKKVKKVLSIVFIILLLIGFSLLVYDFRNAISESITNKTWDPIQERFVNYGFWSIFFISLTQALSILLTVFPGSPIQILAGISIGPLFGFIACISGIFIGNLAIYVLVRKFGRNTEVFYENKELDEIENITALRGKKFFSRFIMALYLIPVIPYGLIAFTASKSKMSYLRFFILTTIGSIPSILLNLLFGKMLMNSDGVTTIILIVVFVLLTILVTVYHKPLIKYLTNRPIKNMAYFQAGVKRPSPIIYFLLFFVMRVFIFPRLKVKFKLNGMKKIDGPYVLLYNHPSKLDFGYAFSPLYPQKINALVAYYYFCNYKLGKLIHKVGGFPKFLYHPDISSIRNTKKVIKAGGIIGIAPEGRLSAYGCLESLAPATEKLIKHLGVPVITAKINGAYLTFPKWSKHFRKGLVEIEYNMALTAEEIKNLSVDEIETKLYEILDYDDFKWQEEKQVYYKGKKFAEGLEHILYYCPQCHSEYTTQTKDDHLFCTHCGLDVKLNNYYQFETDNPNVPKNIRDWYLLQKSIERKNIENEDFTLSSKVRLKFPDPEGKGFKEVGAGEALMNSKGVIYQGTINGKKQEVIFKIENIPAILFGVNEDFEIYHNETLYYFIPENIRSCVKWSIVAEQIYNKYVKER